MPESLLNDQNVYWILWLNTLLHELGVPLPMTPTALVAGARVVTAGVSPVLLVLSIVVAMTLGNAAWFAAGRRYGSAVLKLLCRISISPDTCVARTEGTFGRWGWSALVIGRFLPGVTLVAPPLAGALGMPWSKFLLLTVAGSALFAAVVVGLGMLFHGQIEALLRQLSMLGWETAGILLVLLALYIGWRWRRRRIALAVGLPRIDVPELRRLIDAGEPLELIDVRGRDAAQLDQRRIPGATIMHLEDIEAGKYSGPRDRQIIVYCSCPHEASAAKAVRLLHRHGYLRARPLRGGPEAWFASQGLAEAAR
ncbi:MAG TPA: VTT domain-containing protein [Rubrivivax sp.]|jgi:membrane protein DedA with SNARE-associated domain/rhodanese-related sulfurtransferase|nr:VTT domain-containing protein [Rubrivivax sp.]